MKHLLPLPNCVTEHHESTQPTLVIHARGKEKHAACLSCQQPSRRTHSVSVRAPADLHLGGQLVKLCLSVRRFYCHNSTCKKWTFTEQFPDFFSYRTRRIKRLLEAQRAAGVALGGEASTRLLTRLAMPLSPDAILRLVRKEPVATAATPREFWVDDRAMREGRTYGTILVDSENHRVVELLPDRTSETLAAWLREHLGVYKRLERSRVYQRSSTGVND